MIRLERTALVGLAGSLALVAAACAETQSGGLAEEVIAEARAACEGTEKGVLKLGDGAVTEVDVTGDGKADQIVDRSAFACSTSKELYCGELGCGLQVVAGESVTDLLARSWEVVEIGGRKVLLIEVSGADCGDPAAACYEALVWSEGEFRSVSPFRREL